MSVLILSISAADLQTHIITRAFNPIIYIINYLHSETFKNDCLAALHLLELFLQLDLQNRNLQ